MKSSYPLLFAQSSLGTEFKNLVTSVVVYKKGGVIDFLSFSLDLFKLSNWFSTSQILLSLDRIYTSHRHWKEPKSFVRFSKMIATY